LNNSSVNARSQRQPPQRSERHIVSRDLDALETISNLKFNQAPRGPAAPHAIYKALNLSVSTDLDGFCKNSVVWRFVSMDKFGKEVPADTQSLRKRHLREADHLTTRIDRNELASLQECAVFQSDCLQVFLVMPVTFSLANRRFVVYCLDSEE